MAGSITLWKLVGCCGLAALLSFGLAFWMLSEFYCNPPEHEPQSNSGSETFWKDTERSKKIGKEFQSEMMQQVIKQQREKNRRDMESYAYPNGKYNISANKLEDLVIEENGKPIRSMIISTWRSGSTFLGEIIAAHLSNFYYFEPLVEFGVGQVRGPPSAATSLQIVRGLFNCDYEVLDRFMNSPLIPTRFGTSNEYARLKKHCSAYGSACSNPKFLGALCKLFPFQTMKLVRLRPNVAQELLADKDLAVRMVLLVRDPRATVRSRRQKDWCLKGRDCFDPSLLCADMVSDYQIAVGLQKKYPSTFRVMRYEDLAADPYKRATELSEFYGTGFQVDMERYLDSHTENFQPERPTFRNTKETPYHWKRELIFEEVEEIQRTCSVAMELWGYVQAMNATHQETFDPVTNYVLN